MRGASTAGSASSLTTTEWRLVDFESSNHSIGVNAGLPVQGFGESPSIQSAARAGRFTYIIGRMIPIECQEINIGVR
jgi:hypothetical protein